MSMRNRLACGLFGARLLGCGAALRGKPQSRDAATPEEIAAWDISIGPDGAGLPSGSGTPQQGEAVYLAKCLACHGEKGAGKPNDQLVGGQGTLGAGQVPVKTVGSFWPYATTLFDYVRRAMPLNESKSLTNDEIYAVVAYILQLNGVIGENDTIDAQTLPRCECRIGTDLSVFPEGNDSNFTMTDASLRTYHYAGTALFCARLAMPLL